MKIYMINFLYFLILVLSLNNLTFAMEKNPIIISLTVLLGILKAHQKEIQM